MSEEKQILLPVRNGKETIYDIRIDSSFERLPDSLGSLADPERRVCLVSDSNVWPLYGEQTEKILSACFRSVSTCILPAGEPFPDPQAGGTGTAVNKDLFHETPSALTVIPAGDAEDRQMLISFCLQRPPRPALWWEGRTG